MVTVAIAVPSEYGYIIAVLVAIYLQQNLAFVLQVAQQRRLTGIKAPSFYPRDSEIKALKLNTEQVESYIYAQRVHQNNMELMSFFIPVFLIAGLYAPVNVAIAGASIVGFRFLYGFAPRKSVLRRFAALFHFSELYVLYVAGVFAISLVSNNHVA
ncbi:hypothetical protein HK100_009945 [Physocladia obscura]|uniref:MAPEG family protein n=1 Tax=Physocladia obscura TaxID=109957 RepID=A0AAD5TAK8_9FUNG|nr:hypothetical protein HK100_009945 [Physocladia obscura]